jgi:biotin-(acetyl-CoA carboxylase) ligase
LNDSGIALFVVSSQNLNLKPKLKCISKGFSARTISKLSFDDGEELQVIAVWKPFINGKKIFFEQASSTNTQLLDSSYPVGSSICTPKQISGHGRRGRDWIDTEKSFAGSWKLYDSTTLLEPGLLQIVAGTCVKNSILSLAKDAKGKEILIKWPNDLLVFDSSEWKKVCGILVESRTSGKNMSVVLGIGINLSGTESIGREFEIGFLQSFTKMIKFEDIQNTIDASIASFFEQKDMIPNIPLEDLLQLVNIEVETSISHLNQPLYRDNQVTFKSILNDGKMEIISVNGDVIAIDDGESLTWGKIS